MKGGRGAKQPSELSSDSSSNSSSDSEEDEKTPKKPPVMALGKKADTDYDSSSEGRASHQQSIHCKLSDNYDYTILNLIISIKMLTILTLAL